VDGSEIGVKSLGDDGNARVPVSGTPPGLVQGSESRLIEAWYPFSPASYVTST